jgi:hypothetical protein
VGDAQTRAETYLRLLAEAALRPVTGLEDDRVDRVRRAADILLDAGVLTEEQTTDLLLMLGTALRVRGKQGVPMGLGRARGLGAAAVRLGASRPAEHPWRVITMAPSQVPGSRLMALVVTADRMIAPATLRFPPSGGLDDLTPPAFTDLTASDDDGTDYQLSFTDGSWAGSTWTGTIVGRPAPPPGARQLTITSPNGPLLIFHLTPAPATAPVTAAVGPTDHSPGERLLHRRAEAMLAALATRQPDQALQPFSDEARRRAISQVMEALSAGLPSSPGLPPAAGQVTPRSAVTRSSLGAPPAEPSLPELVATLEGACVLSPLSAVPALVATLAEALGGPHTGAHASDVRLPSRWAGVLAHYGRRHHPPLAAGTGSIGAELPVVEGTSLVIAGVRTSAAGTMLHVVGRNWRRVPLPGQHMGLSWWARDSSGAWHLGMASTWNLANENLTMRLSLFPPLRPGEPGTADTLTLEVTGNTEHLTADLTVHW